MIGSVLIRPSSSIVVLELHSHNSRPSSSSPTISCSSNSRNNSFIPKLEPFNRSKLDRIIKDPPLIQKSENELADYCTILEGDASYSCWRAYFELKDLEKERSKEDVEKLIIEAGGVKSLISCVHGITAIHKAKKEESHIGLAGLKEEDDQKRKETDCPIPDGLPRTTEEVAEEEKGLMPDSPFTRLLRNKGKFPAWYSPVPDHETD
ncbi:CCG-binding protein 1 [Impatiens glandulifera]|uniref:CCG-binding protein 1 n=1 Tax=Impatiens glandulifera TaxID=253017 RepID=UPI001FB07273|nr:CCG-binding protein 1 [Impatiens glandulifera]